MLFLDHNVGKRIVVDSFLYVSVNEMRIYLCGVKLFVTEYVLEHSNINLSALIHKRCGGVAELVDGHTARAETCTHKIFSNHPLHGLG